MKTEFSTADMASFFQAIKDARNGSEEFNCADAWKDLETMCKKPQRQEIQGQSMWEFLTIASNQWSQTLVEETHKLTFRKRHTERQQKWYEGQLRQQHGDLEFEQLKENGTFVETTDKRGNPCFVRSDEWIDDETEGERSATLKRSESNCN